MRISGLQRELAIDVSATIGAMALSLALARIAAHFLSFDVDWRLHLTALTIAAICAPIMVAPLVRANRRLADIKRALEEIAHTDALTGLPNRRAFFERANAMFAAHHGGATAPVLLMIDVDRFKAVNDEYGHDAGDAVLRTVAATIARTVAQAGAHAALAARIGGEEFAAAVDGLARDAVAALAERLCAEVRSAVCEHRGTRLAVTVSIGVAIRAGGEPVDAVLKAADMAVYDAKRRGRNRWRIAAPAAIATGNSTRLRIEPRAAA